ncbi:MAG TPA: hypothetical protein VKY44_07655, partial [Flavobacterium sp.]|nr:hypothetical protein [Flavobacterium sp.]
NATVNKAREAGYEIIGLTATDRNAVENYKAKYNLDMDFYFCDGTTLKTIERANPSFVTLEYGVIMDKKHWNDVKDLSIN